MLSLMTTLPTWTSPSRKNSCLFNSFGYQMLQRWISFKRPFARVPAWLTITFAAHHSSSKVYITSVDSSHIHSMSSNSEVSRYCPTFSLLSFTASRLPDFILHKISVVKEENDSIWHLQGSCHLHEATWNASGGVPSCGLRSVPG